MRFRAILAWMAGTTQKVPLTDPWFEAQFMCRTTATGHEYADVLEGADGIQFWCRFQDYGHS